jgi:hypothetical protein
MAIDAAVNEGLPAVFPFKRKTYSLSFSICMRFSESVQAIGEVYSFGNDWVLRRLASDGVFASNE